MIKRFLRWIRGIEFGYIDTSTGKKRTVRLRGASAEVIGILYRLLQIEIERLNRELAAAKKK